MKVFGISVAILGVLLALVAQTMPTMTIVASSLGALPDGPSRTAVLNIGLLQDQLMVFLAGCTLAIVGGIAAVVGHAIDRLSPASDRRPEEHR